MHKALRGLYKLSPDQRIERLCEAGFINADEARKLHNGGYTLALPLADKMIENVVGVFGLPIGLVNNVRVNGKDYLVPMVVEEPSIVAAASAASRLALRSGGYKARATESLLAGQIELNQVANVDATVATLEQNKSELLDRANAVHPKMLGRGGGARDLEIRRTPDEDRLVLHLLVDTCDAMGANLVNSQCEALAPWIEKITGARTGLKILSNLVDRSLVSASVRFSCSSLGRAGMDGAYVRDAIVAADYFARTDRYRAVTHNKGILNGIDPIAIATGNDWRAISAGAHAWAARDGIYRGLTRWSVTDDGDLLGEMTLPLKTATVGASIAANPGARFCLGLTGVQSARELSQVMAAVGLGQNFAAIRALATTGIQSGHMKLHARSVVAAEGIPEHLAPAVLKRLIASGEIKGWKAQELYQELASTEANADISEPYFFAAGKIILFGEHSVVYGRPGLAVPIAKAVGVRIHATSDSDHVSLSVPDWGIARKTISPSAGGIEAISNTILKRLQPKKSGLHIEVIAPYAAGVGLGASASYAVALIRALDAHFGLGLDDVAVNDHAFAAEAVAHGQPSGIDNTLACYGQAVAFQRGERTSIEPLLIAKPLELVVALAPSTRATREMVAKVASLKDDFPASVEATLDALEQLALNARTALASGDLDSLGRLMSMNHGLLVALGVSTPELDDLVAKAMSAGALGAKLTGGGGGGAIVALCTTDAVAKVRAAFEAASIRNFPISVDENESSTL